MAILSGLHSRRDFLRVGGGLAVAATPLWPPLAKGGNREVGAAVASGGRAKSCILIYLLGGPPQLDTLISSPTLPLRFGAHFGRL
jgi:hypothetical protein